MLTFKKFEIASCGGISKEHPVVLDFTGFNKGKHIGKVTGDQGVGKTSFMNALLYACAHEFGFKTDNLINNNDKALSIKAEFTHGKNAYQISATKSMFRLMKLYKDNEGNEVWKMEDEPKTLVRKIVGNIGVSPMPLKETKGKDQVEWLYTMLNVPADILAKEKQLNEALATATKSRTEANREYDSLKKVLSQSPLFANYEQSEKSYSEVKSVDTAKKNLDSAQLDLAKYDQAKVELHQLKTRVLSIEEEIEDLQQRLDAKKIELLKTNERIANGDKFVAENSSVVTAHESAMNEFMGISEYITNQKEWMKIKQQKADMDDFEGIVAKFDSSKDELKESLRNLVTEVLPDIEGLEVIVDDSIAGKPVGVYINSKTMAQLSESELYRFAFSVWMKNKPSMVFIENITVLGSDAINTLNELAKSGNVYVWATEMVRGQDEMKFEFVDEIK